MILAHISDFHLRPDKKDICLNKIHQIINCIKSKKVQVIVYTGDIVDYRYIGNDEKKKKESYQFALDVFRVLFSNHNLENIIFCPGNHDLTRQDIEETSDCKIIDENSEKYLKAFSLYNILLNDLGLSEEKHYTRTKTITIENESFNFLISNTNCFVKNPNSKSTSDCINCYKVNELANLNLFSGNKNHNIFVSHLPLDYVCECGKHHYQEDDANLSEILFDKFNIFLAGDKHCRSAYSNTYIVGNPLYETESIMSIHKIKKHYHTCEYVKIKENSYSVTSDKTVCDQVFNLSKPHLSSRIAQLINIEGKSNFDIIDKFMQNNGIEKICDVEKMYQDIINFKEYNSDSDDFSNIKIFSFNHIANLIERYEGSNRNVLNLKGEHESGKSTFLSMLFIFLLYKYTYQSYKYIPLYFNIETFRSKGLNSKSIQNQFNEFVGSANEIRSKTNKPICFIIDGLNQYRMFGDNPDLGDYFDEKLKQITDTDNDTTIILSIDTFEHPLDFDKSVFDFKGGTWKNSKYLVYFNLISALPQKEKELIELINCISKIKKSKGIDVKKITSKIFEESIIDIPLVFLYNYIEEFSKNTYNILHYINSQRISNMLKNESQRQQAGEIAVKIFHNNETYAKIFPHGANNKSSIMLFEFIKGHRFFYNYLIAQHYVTEIKKLANYNGSKAIRADSFVNAVFPQPIFYSIRQEFAVKDRKGDVLICLQKVLSNNIINFDYLGIANLIYLLGRNIGLINCDNLDTFLSKLKKNKRHNNTQRFRFLILKRTVTISNIMISENEEECTKRINKYLNDLMKDAELRNINRVFHLMYYQDTYNLMLIQKPYYDIGDSDRWDFYYTYHTLINRIMYSFENGKKSKLLEINIFTLCDLINTRLKHETNEEFKKAFFYSNLRYKTICYILDGVKRIIDMYQAKYADSLSNSLFMSYIINCRNDYEMFPYFIKNNNDTLFMHPSLIINQLNNLKYEERKGWLIYDSYPLRSLSNDMYEKQIKSKSVENVAEHIYMTYLIGLFYLPERIKGNQGYNKQEVLNIILLHDLGEAFTGDCSPYMDEYDMMKNEEDKFNRRLFSSWMYIDNVNLANQMHFWDLLTKKESSNINYQIASDLDKLQLLYQLFMISDTDERFSEERLKELKSVESKIKTSVVNNIKEIIIDKNQKQTIKEFLAENKPD